MVKELILAGINAGERHPRSQGAHELVVPEADELEDVLAAWRLLEEQAAEPSVAAQSGWLIPMIEDQPHAARKPFLVAVENRIRKSLSAVMMMHLETWRWGLPIKILRSWDYPFAFARLPMLHREDGLAALRSFLSGMRRELGVSAVIFQDLPADSVFLGALKHAAARSGTQVFTIARHDRCGVDVDAYPSGDWFGEALSSSRRRAHRKQMKALAKQGAVRFIERSAGEAISPWLDDLLDLEGSGWKGRAGTAIDCDPAERKAVAEAFRRLDQAGQVLFYKLTLAGRTVGICALFRSGEWVWGAKMAYAEDVARYSPGALVIVEATKRLVALDGVKFIDSSAGFEHPLFANVWKDPLPHADVMVLSPDLPEQTQGFLMALEKIRYRSRAVVKKLYRSILRRH